MKTLYIITGHSGAGKTTRAKDIIAWKTFVEKKVIHHYEADMYMIDDVGNYCFDPKRLHFCHKKCYENVKNAMMNGYDVVQSNTNLTKKEVRSYIELAKKLNYNVRIEHMDGEFKNEHNVPDWKISQMKSKREFFTLEDF